MSRTMRKMALAVVGVLGLAVPLTASAHCDTLDGPVVKDAQAALSDGNLDRVLIWVRAEDETEIRQAFQHVQAVRKLGPEASHLADRFFLETVVRVHRLSEGAPYTGLRPAGTDIGHLVPLADKALVTGKLEPLQKSVHAAVQSKLERNFEEARKKRAAMGKDVERGRAYVEAYVQYVHFLEELEGMVHGGGGHAAASASDHAH